MPALRAADQGVADALESVLSDNTQPRLRNPVAHLHRLVRLRSDSRLSAGGAPHRGALPGGPRRLRRQHLPPCAWRPSAIAKAHQWAGHESPGRDRGVREALKGWGRRLAKPQRQAGALTADVLAVIRLTAPKPRARGRGFETAEQAAQRARFDLALVAVLSDGGLRRSEAAALTWGDAQRWDDGSGRITVVRSKTDAEAQGAVVAITPRRHAGAGRYPAGGRWWWAEGVRAVGIADRPVSRVNHICRFLLPH